jgi:hypothetical protein
VHEQQCIEKWKSYLLPKTEKLKFWKHFTHPPLHAGRWLKITESSNLAQAVMLVNVFGSNIGWDTEYPD